MRIPNLNTLRMFDAAARHLNFRLAAEELNLTQGAVAQQVRRLEADLGLQLFSRQPRGLALTRTGKDYHVPVRRALAIIAEATQSLRPESTRITLSVTPSFAAKWLVPRLGGFARTHPDIDLQIVASDALADFKTDGVDLAIRQGRGPFAEELEATLLAPLDLCAISSPDHAATISPIDRFPDFASHRLIQDSHSYWEKLFAKDGLKPQHRILQFNQTALAMDAAANGQGVALAPRLLLGDEIARGRLVVLWRDTRADQSGYHLVHPAAQKPTPARQAVLGWVIAEASASGAELSVNIR